MEVKAELNKEYGIEAMKEREQNKNRWKVMIYYTKIEPSIHYFDTEESARELAAHAIGHGAAHMVLVIDRKEIVDEDFN